MCECAEKKNEENNKKDTTACSRDIAVALYLSAQMVAVANSDAACSSIYHMRHSTQRQKQNVRAGWKKCNGPKRKREDTKF